MSRCCIKRPWRQVLRENGRGSSCGCHGERVAGEGQSDVSAHSLMFYRLGRYENIHTLELQKVYDYIIVGAGSAGCVLANRLSANPFVTVLLLEAGGWEGELADIPLIAATVQGTALDWKYTTRPQEAACFGLHERKQPNEQILHGTYCEPGLAQKFLLVVGLNQVPSIVQDSPRW
ncbi:hypothetical protein HPB51_007521 [Rhipicephalus microplus]|uniref:Glucose-methanol-choline oxidoreductase N-terminal domain-containing protein n=1 Tax=Rhipicephalus microplus TaxID=6941 RepID=A0A9J6E8T1_RHIMP|nr:hypothetical protein HPB51_007521 [Rhipicephalus microplus]